MRSRKDWRRLLLRSAVLAFFGVLFEWLNLFGIPDATHQIGATAFFRAAALFESRADKDDEPIIVLFDEDSLRDMNATWPLSFSQQAKFLDTLTGAYDPSAIFYDIAFYQKRDGVGDFARAIRQTTGVREGVKLNCDRKNAPVPGIPVLLAQSDGHLPWKDLCDAGAEGVLVDWIGDPNTYPLRGCRVGYNTCKDNGAYMAATRLWQIWCRSLPPDVKQNRHLDCERYESGTALYDVVWRVKTDHDQSKVGNVQRCMSSWQQIGQAFRPSQNADTICPQALIVRASSFEACQADPAAEACRVLRKRISKQIVIIGAQLPGLKDQLFSPVFGPVPGVYVHAAAFSNLVSHGDKLPIHKKDYFSSERDSFLSGETLVSFLLLFLSLVVVQRYLEWVNGLAVPLSETLELVTTPLRWFFHRRVVRFHERMDWLRNEAHGDKPPHVSVLRNSAVTLMLVFLAWVIAVAIALVFSAAMYWAAHVSPVLWVGEAILVATISIPEIAATAICATVSPLLFFAMGRCLLRVFLDPPKKEESHVDFVEDDIIDIGSPG